MKDLSLLSEEEYTKICSAIPHKIIVGYFQKNPKEFSKLCRGFRATAIQNKDAIRLLVLNRESGFISSFIGKIVSDWLNQIQLFVIKYQKNGESEITSYIHTLYQSYFAENVAAYFKLIGKEYSEDQLLMISNLVALLKSFEKRQHELETLSSELKEELKNTVKKVEKGEKQLEKVNEKLTELTSIQSELKALQKEYQKLLIELEQLKKEKETTVCQVNSLNQKITLLNEVITSLQIEKEQLEISIRTKIEEEKKAEELRSEASLPIAPIDIEEFCEYFSYNLDSIGVTNSDLPINTLLTNYISHILFQGKPIICNKSYVNTFAKCISNTLVNNAPINHIVFSSDLGEKQILSLIKNSGRILILDNFLGNYNETILLSILDAFKSKIIILSFAYEKTLFYLPKDLLAYCYYINLSHIPSFVRSINIDEDPSEFEENEIMTEYPSKNKYKDIILSIALELGYSDIIAEIISDFVCDETSSCAVLLFNLIPYINDVFEKNAFNVSAMLQRYVNRSSYKKVFEEWFMK